MGIKEFVSYINDGKDLIHDEIVYFEAKRGDEAYLVRDDRKVLEWFLANRGCGLDGLVAKCAANADFWGEDINRYL